MNDKAKEAAIEEYSKISIKNSKTVAQLTQELADAREVISLGSVSYSIPDYVRAILKMFLLKYPEDEK